MRITQHALHGCVTATATHAVPAVCMVCCVRACVRMQGIQGMAASTYTKRITQANGLALFILFIVFSFWLVFGRWVPRPLQPG